MLNKIKNNTFSFNPKSLLDKIDVWRPTLWIQYDPLSKSIIWAIFGKLQEVWPEKNCQMSIKVAQKWFHQENDTFWHLHKNCLRMWEIRAYSLVPKPLKTCPKSNKLPNMVTLVVSNVGRYNNTLWGNPWFKNTINASTAAHIYLIIFVLLITSVIRWFDYFSIFGHLQQWKLAQ